MNKVDTIKYNTFKLDIYDTGDISAYDSHNHRSGAYVCRTAEEFKDKAVMLFRWNCGFMPSAILSRISAICALFQQ